MIFDYFHTFIQFLLPQRILTWIFGQAANCTAKPWKNWMIRRFARKYQVNINEALLENPEDYPNFNAFFIRRLKPELRPICPSKDAILSPVDGHVRQIGFIEHGKIFNAKGHAFTLYELLGGNLERTSPFLQGAFANLYLAPNDYHRVHMPYKGTLKSMIYIPGKLFSVRESTANTLPRLFSRNERLVLFFDTAIGPMAMILVGAMIVGSLSTVWHGDITRTSQIQIWHYEKDPMTFEAGDEIGTFKLGSTVILLFTHTAPHLIQWESNTHCSDTASIRYGQKIARINPA